MSRLQTNTSQSLSARRVALYVAITTVANSFPFILNDDTLYKHNPFMSRLPTNTSQSLSARRVALYVAITTAVALAAIFGIKQTSEVSADPPACPFTCASGESLLDWNDAGWNGGTGWVDGETGGSADPNNALLTPQVYTNFDGMGNNITATFSGNPDNDGDGIADIDDLDDDNDGILDVVENYCGETATLNFN